MDAYSCMKIKKFDLNLLVFSLEEIESRRNKIRKFSWTKIDKFRVKN